MAKTEIDGLGQIQDSTITRAKIVADFLEGSNLDLTGGNNDATLTGLANGVANDDAVNKGQMDAAISAAITGGMTYIGTLDASAVGSQLDDRNKGDFFLISAAGTIDGLDFSIGDHLVVSDNITGSAYTGKIDKIDNTESDDIIRSGDVVDDLTTGGTDVPLSAEQGKVLKGLTDANAKRLNERVFGENPARTIGSPTLPALANIPVTNGALRVYLNGLRMFEGSGNDYTVNYSTGVITFEYNMKNKDNVLCDYEYVAP